MSIENKIYFRFTLSLTQCTLANIAITLWNQDDVRYLMSNLHILHEKWKGIEKAVIEKSLKLKLPKGLNENLLCFIGRVGLQILSWVDFHHSNCLVIQLPARFVWTCLGTIDNIKTAELLLKSGTLDHYRSFILACIYCLENKIEYYWNISIRNFSYNFFTIEFKSVDFILYWITYLYQFEEEKEFKEYEPGLMICHRSFITEATRNGNEAATRYFFKTREQLVNYSFKALSVEIVEFELFNLGNVTSLQRYSDIMLFLLSEVNTQEQTNLIVKHTFAFLKCLLVWPWHSLLLKMLNNKWNLLSKNEYKDLLQCMVHLMRYDHHLHKLFVEFWQQSPEDYKQFLTDEGHIVHLLRGLYKRGDEKNIKLISEDSSILTTENIFKIESKPIFLHLISSEKLLLIKILIEDCLSSREDLIRFRDVFKKHEQRLHKENNFCKGGYSKVALICLDQFKKFFQLVDDCILKYDKLKRYIEPNNSLSKRRCIRVLKNY